MALKRELFRAASRGRDRSEIRKFSPYANAATDALEALLIKSTNCRNSTDGATERARQ